MEDAKLALYIQRLRKKVHHAFQENAKVTKAFCPMEIAKLALKGGKFQLMEDHVFVVNGEGLDLVHKLTGSRLLRDTTGLALQYRERDMAELDLEHRARDMAELDLQPGLQHGTELAKDYNLLHGTKLVMLNG